jgi:uncharacterized ParB-like nuclease family protein
VVPCAPYTTKVEVVRKANGKLPVEVWVLGDVAPLHPVDAHTIEQDGMRLYLEYGGEIVLQVRAEDPCGQQGLAQIAFSY